MYTKSSLVSDCLNETKKNAYRYSPLFVHGQIRVFRIEVRQHLETQIFLVSVHGVRDDREIFGYVTVVYRFTEPRWQLKSRQKNNYNDNVGCVYYIELFNVIVILLLPTVVTTFGRPTNNNNNYYNNPFVPYLWDFRIKLLIRLQHVICVLFQSQ